MKNPRLAIISLLFCALIGHAALADTSTVPVTDMQVTNLHRTIASKDAWLNTSRPITADELKGRIILLDFWTYCCINCMHVIPDLKYLEQQFGDKLTVIGIHSAKFQNEKDSENIRAAILRYDIEHPVVNDADFAIWQAFGVKAWPTFVLINPAGIVEGTYSGEGHRFEIAAAIEGLLTKYKGRINTDKLPIALEKDKTPPTVLSFPGKLAAALLGDEDGNYPVLFVSDSGHNRILGLGGMGGNERSILHTVGSGREGFKDGSFEEAEFRHPQGLLYDGHILPDGKLAGILYVADTENHALRKIDFNAKTVTTIAGTGVQGYDRTVKNAPALQTPLASPWDLAFYPDDKHIVIAMAGLHQLWSYDIAAKTVSVIAGNGNESIDDGEYPSNSLSQPSGLSAWRGGGEPHFNLEITGFSNVTGKGWIGEKSKPDNVPSAPKKVAADGRKLYFVDAETSSLRVFDGSSVKTLIGTGLFDFGYKEGKQGTALMQHDLGVFADASGIYVADSYNHSIRRYDPATGILSNFAGHGERGNADGPLATASFNEPNAIIKTGNMFGGVFYVADTNNNAIRVIKDGNVSTLNIQVPAPEIAFATGLPNVQKLASMAIGTQASVTLSLQDGWHINPDAPSTLAVFDMSGKPKAIANFDVKALQTKKMSLPELKAGTAYELQATLYYCANAAGSQCLIKSFDVPLMMKADGQKEIMLKLN